MKISLNVLKGLGNKFGLTTTDAARPEKLGTFGGVFTPTVLTILGVIMYLRLGWVVGNAGLLGAIVIILLAKAVTICTGLSMSSITTNIKIGAGGAYSIISKSLGLEAGGSVGIPFYISQTLSAALYIIGFTEGWLRIFPDHAPLLVSSVAWIGNFEDASFWQVFAIYFPAVTGIMAGANLSGDLKDPRKAIPFGTMSAIAITLVIYIGLAYFAARFASPAELRANQMIMVDKALWGPAVVLGILAATFSSALGSMLGAPRILQALAEQRTVPFHKTFAIKSKNNEPRNAIIFTGIVIEIALILGDLNALAALITMFFLITYGMLNLVVFIQQGMKIISFRPTFRIPHAVPFLGAAGCLFMMFLINPIFSIVAITTIAVLYVWLTRRGLESEWGDIRGGMFLVLAERAARVAAKFPRHQISWKPDLLIPIEDPKIWAGPLLFIRSITYPSGSIFAFTVREDNLDETRKDLEDLLSPIEEQDVLIYHTVIEDNDFLHGAKLVIQTLKGGAFRPNTLFLTLGSDNKKDDIIKLLATHAAKHELGMIILRQHPRMAFGMQNHVNLWLRDKSPNWHLAMLIALQLQSNWEGRINLVTATPDINEQKRLYDFLERLSDQARLPSMTDFHVLSGNFRETMAAAPRADINIFGTARELAFDFMRNATEWTKSSCLFVKDSGRESALV
jgi:amino acid transporter